LIFERVYFDFGKIADKLDGDQRSENQVEQSKLQEKSRRNRLPRTHVVESVGLNRLVKMI